MARPDYLYRRGETWWVRFVYPPDLREVYGKEVRRSLGTTDKAQARLLAEPLIHEHRMRVLAAQNRRGVMMGGRLVRRVRVAGFKWLHEPGDCILGDGTRVVANEASILFIKDGRVVEEQKNDLRIIPAFTFDPAEIDKSRRPAVSSADKALLDLWINHKGVTGHIERDARGVFDTFRTVVGKPWADCTRDDGRKLVKHYKDQGLKSATIEKKVGFLRAAVNLGIKEAKLKFNPFSDVVPKTNDALDRVALDDRDMKLMRDRLHELDPQNQLLWIWLATTGMRLSEVFQATTEVDEHGIRTVTVGTKSDSSHRRLPIPSAVLERIPARIERCLFTDSPKNRGRHLLRQMRRVGITDPAKVLHSLRHRAASRLRALGADRDTRLWIMGHDKKTAHDGYGEGPPMAVLLPWIEKIGWGE